MRLTSIGGVMTKCSMLWRRLMVLRTGKYRGVTAKQYNHTKPCHRHGLSICGCVVQHPFLGDWWGLIMLQTPYPHRPGQTCPSPMCVLTTQMIQVGCVQCVKESGLLGGQWPLGWELVGFVEHILWAYNHGHPLSWVSSFYFYVLYLIKQVGFFCLSVLYF